MAASVVCFVCLGVSPFLDIPVLVILVCFVGEDVRVFGDGVLGIDGSELGRGGDSSHVLNTDETVCHFCERSVEWGEVGGGGCSIVGVGCHFVVRMAVLLSILGLINGHFLWYCFISAGACTWSTDSQVLSASGYPFHFRRYCNSCLRP